MLPSRPNDIFVLFISYNNWNIVFSYTLSVVHACIHVLGIMFYALVHCIVHYYSIIFPLFRPIVKDFFVFRPEPSLPLCTTPTKLSTHY